MAEKLLTPLRLKHFVALITTLLTSVLLYADTTRPLDGTQISFSVIITGQSSGSLEAMVVDGGAWTTPRQLVHTAVLIKHPRGTLLWDSGLGTQIEEQMEAFSWWQAQLFKVENVNPAVFQLRAAGISPEHISAIIPSHMHWDHVSALEDFAGIPVWVQAAEHEEATQGNPPAFITSQFDSKQINWAFFTLEDVHYKGFDRSRDIYGDESVVLVDLSGHTRGQLGLFLNTPEGQSYFFIGDTAWTKLGVENNRGRPVFVDWLVGVDSHYENNAAQLNKIHQLKQRQPDLIIVPAHDELVNRSLPVFPEFL